MPGKRERQALEREARLEKIAEQVAAGTLWVRMATAAERASWPAPRRPLHLVDPARDELRPPVLRVLERAAPKALDVAEIADAVRALPDAPRPPARTLRRALAAWAGDPGSRIVTADDERYTVRST